MSEKTFLTSCPASGCHGGCLHLTEVRDGKIAKSKAFTYPDGREGFICRKGMSGARLPYHRERLKRPLKRAGKRGEGKWQEISWEQALDEIADRITRIRREYNPESLVIWPPWNSWAPPGSVQHLLAARLRNLLQATDIFHGCPYDSNPPFASYMTLGRTGTTLADPRVILEGKTKYMIIWGANQAEMNPRFMKIIAEAQKNGVKLVDIGLIRDATAAKADWWLQVNPGSDGALALAMIGVIVKERLFDEEFVRSFTNGPFLVRADNGSFLRERDLIPDNDSDKYLVWDLEAQKVKAVSPGKSDLKGIKPALSGTFQPGGITCRPAFQLLTDLAFQYDPEKVEGITGVSSATIEKLAREYAAQKPAALLVCFGLRYKNSGNAYRAMHTLSAITGNTGTLGGGVINGGVTAGMFNAPGLCLNDESILLPTEARPRSISMADFFQCMIAQDPYPIKALVIYHANPFHTLPNRRRWIEEVIPNLELIVVDDIFMTETAAYADYVLPDCTIFERQDMDIGWDGHIVFLDRAIAPMHDARPPIYLWSELAKRLGLGAYFDKTVEEWIAFRLASKHPSVADINPQLTVERLKKEKVVRASLPKKLFQPFLDKKFSTPSGRIEFYCEELVPAKDALPVFREQMESPRGALAEQYPLVFFTGNNRYFMHTLFANDPETLKRYKEVPHISINPDDAKKRGISEGDRVVVYNDRGKCQVNAAISKAVPPGVVHIPHGWWPRQFAEGHPQDLIASLAGPDTADDAREIHWSIACERGSREASMRTDTLFAKSPDTLFDCLCEVKKAEP